MDVDCHAVVRSIRPANGARRDLSGIGSTGISRQRSSRSELRKVIMAFMAPVETFRVPTATAMDRIEIGYNVICFVLGLPINLMTLKWLLERKRRQQQSPTVWLHLNLNLSDLFVLVFYCFGRFCWLLTYQWYGGEWLCKSMRFAEVQFHSDPVDERVLLFFSH